MTAPIYHCAATLSVHPAVIGVAVYDGSGRIVDDAGSRARESATWSAPVRDIFNAHNARRAKMTHVAMDNAACIRLLTDDDSGETVAVVYAYAPGPLSKSLPKIMRAILRNRNKARVDHKVQMAGHAENCEALFGYSKCSCGKDKLP